MGDVTNVILTMFLEEDARLDELNALPWYRGERGLVSCTDERFDPRWYGGDTHLEMNIWLGAFRDLDVDALVSAIQQIEWEDPECVRLYLCEGDAGRFTRIDLHLPTTEQEDGYLEEPEDGALEEPES